MSPTEVAPAITRLLMLTAGPIPDDLLPAVHAAMRAFDGDAAALRRLSAALAVQTAEKLPDGGTLAFGDAADIVAVAIVQHGGHTHGCIDRMVDDLPIGHLADIATALLAMWRQACSQAAAATLARLTVPEHAPQEGGRA